MKKKALITGVTGQDGAYLAEYLIGKGYQVHGMRRRASLLNVNRIAHMIGDPHDPEARLLLHYGDMTDSSNLIHIMQKVQPDEVYNLAAQSHVHVSFETPEYTASSDALGTLRLLEAIRILGLMDRTRFYQASTSELYGLVQEPVQTEQTPFYPRSPYAVAKLYAYWITVNYREAYGFHASNGILFNHESPIRGETFVTRKVTLALSRILLGLQKELFLGNMNAKRDWGHARDCVRAMWLMLQQEQPADYVIATGYQYSVREFVEHACRHMGVGIEWRGEGVGETGVVASIERGRLEETVQGHYCPLREGDTIIRIDPYFFRPTEVETLIGDATRARETLGWTPEISFEALVGEMMEEDLRLARQDAHLKQFGMPPANRNNGE